MPNTAPIGNTVTVLMTVDSTARIGLFSGGEKIAEQEVGNAAQVFPLIVSTLRFGATEPGGYNPGAFLMEKISAWTAPLSNTDALLVSANLAYTPPISTGPLPVLSLVPELTVREGLVLQIPVTKTGAGACSATIRTIGDSATTPLHYTGFSQTITFDANVTLINIPLTTVTTAAADSGKKLAVVLEAASGCTFGNARTVVTITELPRISVPTLASVNEGAVLNLIVTKTGAGACSVTWRTQAISASVALSDYLGQLSTVLNFAENETQKTVSITTLADATVEQPETFHVYLEDPVGCTITTNDCIVTILDASSPEVPVQTALTPANGYASSSTFGLGYPVVKVTNLNDSGAGSLREALSGGNRVIVFEVGGRIILSSDLTFYQNNVTVAGETAPAPGITIQKFAGLANGSHVDIRHLCFEKGYFAPTATQNSGTSDAFRIATGSKSTGAARIVTTHVRLSHCAFYWAMDGTLDMNPVGTREPKNISMHDCIFAEPLRWPNTFDPKLSNHPKVKPSPGYVQNQHNYGVLFAAGVRTVDMQYCLFADCDFREPFIDHSTEIVLANIIANNCGKGATSQQNVATSEYGPVGVFKTTVKGYLCISGPDTGKTPYSGYRFHQYVVPQPANSAVYVTGLYAMRGGTAADGYETPGTTVTYSGVVPYWLNGTTKVPVEVSAPPIDTPVPTVALGSGQEIFDRAVLNVGPRPKEIRELIAGTMTIGNKDVARTIRQLKAKTGRWPNHEDETQIGGFYAPAQVTRTLNSTAKFRDGTLIGVPPTGLATPTATSRAEMAAWLRKHLDQVQND